MNTTLVLQDEVWSGVFAELRQQSKKALYRRDFAAWQYDVLGEKTYAKMEEIGHDVLFAPKPRTAIKSANGTAKDLALDTPILTTEGWSTMGALREGQYVFDEQGLPTRITVKSEVMHNRCYRITFDDGSTFVAGEGHLWNTISLNARSHMVDVTDWREHWDRAETLMTRQIAATVGTRAKNHLVPLAKPLQYAEAALPLPPYVLGAWLGDGTSIRAEITCDYAVDGYVVDQIRDAGYPLYHRTTDPTRPYSFMAVSDTAAPSGNASSRLKLTLREMNLLGNKHIPEAYFTASVAQRIALVRGLMDTDGTADKRGSLASFGQSKERIVRDFERLLSTLGVRFSTTSRTTKLGGTAWKVAFRSWFDPFTPGERKSKIYQDSSPKQASRLTGRTIVSVEPTLTVPTACISVESPSRLYLAGRTLVPTHNTFQAARWGMWWVTVFDPRESLAILSAPTLKQVEMGLMAYMKDKYGAVKDAALKRGEPMPWPGWINEQGDWKYSTLGGNQTLVASRVPSAQDAVTTMQGLRKEGARNLILLDEGGGVKEPVYVAIEALMTSDEGRACSIGNPDERGTYFYQIFNNPEMAAEYNLHTITAYDLPTMTGERVYGVGEEDKERRMLKGLTSAKWVAHKERAWMTGGEEYFDEQLGYMRRRGGTPNGRFKSKVQGEFPGDADNTFFSETYINRAMLETEIEPEPDAPIVLGVDIAGMGEDETVVYVNKGGRLRIFSETIRYQENGEWRETSGVWSKEEEFTSALRVHAIAKHLGASRVQIDGTAIGGPVGQFLMRGGEFADRTYEVIFIKGSRASSDITRWRNWRDEIHEYFSDLMRDGKIDLDPADASLKAELMLITYKLVNGAVKIDTKRSMKTMLGGSPDRADAAMYAALDTTALADPDAKKPGDTEVKDPYETLGYERYGDGYPI